MNFFPKFSSFTLLAVLLLLAVTTTQAGNLRQTQEHTDQVIKGVIMSSVHNDGEVGAAQMENAKAVGFKEQEVEYLVSMAQEKGEDIVDFLNSVYILPVEATQWAMHHVEVIPKDTSKINKNPVVRDPTKYEVDGPFGNKVGASAHKDVEEERLSAFDQEKEERQLAAPDALANALESAVKSEDGSVSPQSMQVAMASGWSKEEVLHIVGMALESVQDNGGDKSEVLSEIQKLRGPKKEEKPKNKFVPLPTHTWTA